MDGTQPGELGVMSWCDMIRFSMAKDPGRQFLDVQIQKQGFDFLDSYLENVISRPKEEPMYELLKTPGRKKDAPKRTRAATAAKAKAMQTIAISLEDGYEDKVLTPVNNFHKALLEAKNKLPDDIAPRPPSPRKANDENIEQPVPPPVKMKTQRIVTIADTPEIQRVHMEVDEPAEEQISPLLSPSPSPASLPAQDEVYAPLDPGQEAIPDEMSEAESAIKSEPTKELSMIVEDDEAGERSRISIQPRRSHGGRSDMDITVPLRDAEPTTTLNRKPSMSQFAVPAPSPLRKSIVRPIREPSSSAFVAPALAHTPGAGLGGKRTSWLVKAKEAKALEMTGSGGKKSNQHDDDSGLSLGIAGGAFGGNKRKSGEMLGLGIITKSDGDGTADEEERTSKVARLADHSEVSSTSKGKGVDAAMDAEPKPNHQSVLPAVDPVLAHRLPTRPEPQSASTHSVEDFTMPLADVASDEGALHRFKRTVEGLGVRAGKSMGKSLGGNAAAALAEARAAAEARVAERNKEDGLQVVVELTPPMSDIPGASQTEELKLAEPVSRSIVPPGRDSDRRLSISDLVNAHGTNSNDQKSAFAFKPLPSESKPSIPRQSIDIVGDTSTSTTPPHSPPPPIRESSAVPPPPVFSKPPTVFMPPPAVVPTVTTQPSPGLRNEFGFKFPAPNPFSLPAAMTLGVPASFPSSSNLLSSKQPSVLSAQSSKTSVYSDVIFDKEDDIPAWMPSTQDTDYSIQPSDSRQKQLDELDDEDSWHVDDKFKANQMWTPFGFASTDKDDTMTWSTLPSRSTSQKGGDTAPLHPTQSFQEALQKVVKEQPDSKQAHGNSDFDSDMDKAQAEIDEADLAMEVDEDDLPLSSELDDIVAAGKSTISLVEPKNDRGHPEMRSQSQQSMASTSSSQSQLGFFGHASKLVSSVLGGGKKTKPEPVKSIQLAAVAAKKQQEEAEKKAARLKEMENRRQLALQRKADEEKARALGEERKVKEEAERRKREREEHTDKRPLRSTTKKADEDTTKKRKMIVEIQQKPDSKKPPSRENQPSRLGKPISTAAPGTASKTVGSIKSALRQPAAAPSSSNPTTEQKATRAIKTVASSSSLKPTTAKGKGKAQATDDSMDQRPSETIQAQMANRVKAQMQSAAPREPPPVASESIELPDINSEYSDSEDEDRPRTFDPPGWAQSPELRQALQQQSRMNPDDIFGRIGPLRMEEIFRTRQSRFRARTSSANWVGTDQLTAEEEREYARRMGYR